MAVTAAPAPAPQLGRGRPALTLALSVLFIGIHHWWVLTQQEMFPKLLLTLFIAAGWAVGGILYPPSFYSLTKFGTHLPRSAKVAGAVFAMAGFALGFYLMLNMYEVKY
jgi:hypothetical protein